MADYSPSDPVIIVKFKEGGLLEEKEGRLQAEHLSLDMFYRTLESVDGSQAQRSFRSEASLLREWQIRATKRLKRAVPGMYLFVDVRLTGDVDDIDALIKKFAADPEVEYAALAPVPGPPAGVQDYHHSASSHGGVDAEYAWSVNGGKGDGVKVCVCDNDFGPHNDLPSVQEVRSPPAGWSSQVLNGYAPHGTDVIRIIAGKDDADGVTGISPKAQMLFSSTLASPSDPGVTGRRDSVETGMNNLSPGDILVLELQVSVSGSLQPMEADLAVHGAVRNAVGNGIVVVELAGNGGIEYVPSPDLPDPDSLAIIVGAGTSGTRTTAHSKLPPSNYGARVNCQGWGENTIRGNTSGATAMVAGVVACLQGAAKIALGTPLDPLAIRSLLRDPANGTSQTDSALYPAATHHIGPLPDLRKLLDAVGITSSTSSLPAAPTGLVIS